MDTTELATHWQRDGYLEVETKQVRPNVSTPPHTHPFDARGLMEPYDGMANLWWHNTEELLQPTPSSFCLSSLWLAGAADAQH